MRTLILRGSFRQIMGCTELSWRIHTCYFLSGLKSLRNSSSLKNRRCALTLKAGSHVMFAFACISGTCKFSIYLTHTQTPSKTLSFVGMDSIVESANANADVTCERNFIYIERRNAAHRPRNISVLTAGFYLLKLLNLRAILHVNLTSNIYHLS